MNVARLSRPSSVLLPRHTKSTPLRAAAVAIALKPGFGVKWHATWAPRQNVWTSLVTRHLDFDCLAGGSQFPDRVFVAFTSESPRRVTRTIAGMDVATGRTLWSNDHAGCLDFVGETIQWPALSWQNGRIVGHHFSRYESKFNAVFLSPENGKDSDHTPAVAADTGAPKFTRNRRKESLPRPNVSQHNANQWRLNTIPRERTQSPFQTKISNGATFIARIAHDYPGEAFFVRPQTKEHCGEILLVESDSEQRQRPLVRLSKYVADEETFSNDLKPQWSQSFGHHHAIQVNGTPEGQILVCATRHRTCDVLLLEGNTGKVIASSSIEQKSKQPLIPIVVNDERAVLVGSGGLFGLHLKLT